MARFALNTQVQVEVPISERVREEHAGGGHTIRNQRVGVRQATVTVTLDWSTVIALAERALRNRSRRAVGGGMEAKVERRSIREIRD